MKYTNSNLIRVIKNSEKKTFDVYYKHNLVCIDAEKFEIFEDKILAILKRNYLFVYTLDKNNFKLRSSLRKDGAFENALIFLDEFRYIVTFKCQIICCGRC